MKRKTIALTLLCVMLMTLAFSVPTAAAEEAVIPNGDFSSWTSDAYHSPSGWNLGNVARYVHVKTDAPNPYMYFSLVTSATSKDIPVTAGTAYTLSYRLFVNDKSSGVNIRLFYKWKYADGTASAEIQNYAHKQTDAWRLQQVSLTAPANAVSMCFRIHIDSLPTDADMRFDDFVLNRADYIPGNCISNSDMELVQDDMPIHYAISGTATIEEDTVHSGNTALKITGDTAEATTTVSAEFIANGGTKFYDTSAYMNLSAFTEGSGVKMEIYQIATNAEGKRTYTKKSETEFFDALEKGWRKMLLRYTPTAMAHVEIRITFTGAGTVYLDDVSAIGTNNLIINGDLEGFSGDETFIQPIPGTTAYNSISLDETKTTSLRTENENHYMFIQNTTSPYTNYTIRDKFEKGARYRLSFDFKSAGGAGLWETSGIKNLLGVTPETGTVWAHYDYYFTCTNGTSGYTFISLGLGDTTKTASYDNISLVKMSTEEIFGIFDENGKKVETAQAGETYTAKYEGFGTDYAVSDNNKYVTLIFALYEKRADGSLNLREVKIDKGRATKIPFANQTNAIPQSGEVPLVLEKTIPIPDNGKTYELRAMALDGLTNMKAYFEAVTA